jgi:hypothetical protein
MMGMCVILLSSAMNELVIMCWALGSEERA